jgi:hypothetical protein
MQGLSLGSLGHFFLWVKGDAESAAADHSHIWARVKAVTYNGCGMPLMVNR